MKWSFALAAAVVLTVLFGLPFREHDTAKLLPAKTLQVERLKDGAVHLVSEIGEGVGQTWRAAVDNLRGNASGEVFFQTVEQVVFCGEALTIVPEALESGDLRPSAQVYEAASLQETEGLYDYLSAHAGCVSMGELRASYAEK